MRDNKRHTRKAYNRKLIIFGVMVFMAISLIATGFASWIVSFGSSQEASGNVSVGTVENNSVQLTASINTDEIIFDAQKDDLNGYYKWDGTNYENLSITVSGTISPYSVVDDVVVKLDVPDSVKAAATAGYIVLPEAVNGVSINDLNKYLTKVEGEAEKYTYSYTIKFEWGNLFGGKNPSVYLDEAISAGTLTTEESQQLLINFRNAIAGKEVGLTGEIKFEDDGNNENGYEGFHISISATTK